ncbi:MAG: Gldg family protein [Spirulinaceae cyanobacterium]
MTKMFKSQQQPFKYLFLFGPFFFTAGLVAGLISGMWSSLPIILLSLGLIISIAGLFFFSPKSSDFWGRNSIKAGTNALISTLAILIILGLINFVTVRYGPKIDLTENKILTLAPQTEEILQKLDQPVQVVIFDRQLHPSDRSLLQDYQRQTSNFSYELVDPQINLGLAKQFEYQSPGEVHLSYGTKKQLVQTVNENTALSEASLSNAIERIQKDTTPKIYFLQGHGELSLESGAGGLSQAVTSLDEKGYPADPLTLADSPDIPEDTTTVIVAGAQRPLFTEEVAALRKYLNNGGSLLLLLEPDAKTGLDPLLKEWGVVLDNRLVIDASGSGRLIGLGPDTALVNNYGNHPITEDFGNGISLYRLARTIDSTEKPEIQATALLITNEDTWAESDIEAGDVEFNEENDLSGPLNLGYAFSRRDGEEDQKGPVSKLVVIGDSTFASNGWFEQHLDGDIFLNSVKWLGQEKQETLSISAKEQTERRLNLTKTQAGILAWSAILILPVLSFATAGVVWWQRR